MYLIRTYGVVLRCLIASWACVVVSITVVACSLCDNDSLF